MEASLILPSGVPGFRALIPLSDGGYVGVGDGQVSKLDSDLKVDWETKVLTDESKLPSLTYVAQAADGGYLYSGSYDFSNNWVYGKLNKNGTVAWQTIDSTVNGAAVKIMEESGGYRVFGYKGTYDKDIAMVRTDGSGTNKATIVTPLDGSHYVRDVLPVSGGYLFIGDTASQGFIAKVDSAGNLAGTVQLYGAGRTAIESINPAPDSSGDYLLTGNQLLGSAQNALLLRIGADGTQKWLRTYPVGTSLAFSWSSTREGGFIVSGGNNSGNGVLIKTDREGNTQWCKWIEGSGNLFYVKQLADGSYEAAGGNLGGTFVKVTVGQPAVSADDDANLIVGLSSSMEYSMNGGTSYTAYDGITPPVFEGDATVLVRYKQDYSAGYEAGAPRTLTFTVNPVPVVAVELVAAIDDITVPYGTESEALELPSEVNVSLSNGDEETVSVAWDSGTPDYSGNVSGTYVFKGTLILPDGVTNPAGLQATVNVIVGKQPPAPVVVDSVAAVEDISVPYGTSSEALDLPSEVKVSLSNGDEETVNVAWDSGTPAYDGNVSGTYEFKGALTLPEGVTNPEGLKATVNVIVGEKPPAPLVTVVSVASIDDITVPYGTESEALELPSEVIVSLSNGDKDTVSIAWDEGTPAYDGNVSGTYTFKGTLTLPDGVTNPEGLQATANVIVGEQPPAPIVTIESVATIDDITVPYGTASEALEPPSKVEVSLSNGDKETVSVAWDEGTPAYDGNVSGTYTFKGTLTLPDGVTNPRGLQATVNVIVGEQTPAPVVTVESVAPIDDITVPYGTTLEALELPSEGGISLSNGDEETVSVAWDEGTPAYDGNVSGTYTFKGTLTLPDGVTNPEGLQATVNVNVGEQPPAPIVTVESVASIEDITVPYGTASEALKLPSEVEVSLSNGDKKTTSVTWNESAPAYNGNLPGTYVFKGALTLPDGVTNPRGLHAAVNVIVGEQQVTPQPPVVSTPNPATNITVACGTVACSAKLGDEAEVELPDGLFDGPFTLTIEKKDFESGTVPVSMKPLTPVYELLKSFAGKFSKPVKLTFKFDVAALEEGRHAALFYYDEVKNEWIEVEGHAENSRFIAQVDHFTKFAVFSVEDAPVPEFSDLTYHWAREMIVQAASRGIVEGYSDGSFRPNATVTRAEFTAMLVRALGIDVSSTSVLSFSDASRIETWAQPYAAAAAQARIVTGFADGSFRPDAEITRAEMTNMIARAIGLATEDSADSPFADLDSIPAWARSAAVAAGQAGIVTGADGNRFAPERLATRAEATVMLWRMLDYQDKE
ncbi:DUF4073 domain-containing protein [Cohnella thailandensis]|uniref:DUF4073 domain-containing protein n=1 Tax=Cohnella thailandensis TaxID=557557 RepID=A0A841SQK1_9BACL|nr:DUF4073 domain-containing protein [Cohnella thailandensis]MBB6633472.1 DUF4073 domain-containing protein [Cohnella thailandensis]MBP1974489.1 hypothetical protein [Cohnella thailandensis]